MKPLIVLLVTFLVTLLTGYLLTHAWQTRFSGNLAMCIMLLFTALGHFKFKRGMAMMMPELIRHKELIVVITGIVEIVLAVLLLFPELRFYAGVLLVAMFIAFLPANISAARRRVNYETASYDGPGPSYLYFRVPMQIFLIAWVICFSVLDFWAD